MVGFVMLCGIIVNNGIVFIDYTNQLRQEGMSKTEALVETGRTRMRPILHDCADNDSRHVHDGSRIWRWKRYGSADGDRNDRRYDLWNHLTLFVVPVIYDIFNRKEIIPAEEVSDEL